MGATQETLPRQVYVFFPNASMTIFIHKFPPLHLDLHP